MISQYDLDVNEDIDYWNCRFDDFLRIRDRICRRLLEYLAYCRAENLRVDEFAVRVIEDFETNSAEMLIGHELGLHASLSVPEYNFKITALLQKYRALLHIAMSASMVLDWRSASYKQSLDTMFFGLESQDNPGVNYNRYESGIVSFVEKNMTQVLDFDPVKTTLYITSSGMAAYTLLESYLIRYVLIPGDTVLLPHYIYFESDEQISKVSGIQIERSTSLRGDDLIRVIQEKSPKVVFLDPLTNTDDLRMTDVEAVIGKVSELVLENDLYFVVDGSMMSGEFNPFSALNNNPRVKVLYYDSCSKYMQLGLDMAMGGLVVVPVELASIFDRLRRNTGTIMYDSEATVFPIYSRETHQRRMKRFSRNAALVGRMISEDVQVSAEVKPIFPLLETHLDYDLARRFNSVGGVITFKFESPELNGRDALNRFIELALTVAKDYQISLTKGVSFGFSIPRISAAAAMAETIQPFLRLSVGDRSYQETQLLATALVESFRGYIKNPLGT